uniref:Uncharacterized protein n=1 Tax=Panagrolaimus sp. ES5 TaxID=591445 RepID=A0AC34GXD0_9BILA
MNNIPDSQAISKSGGVTRKRRNVDMVEIPAADEPPTAGDLMVKRRWHISQAQRSYIVYICSACEKNSFSIKYSNDVLTINICSTCGSRNAESGVTYSEFFVNKKSPLVAPLSSIVVDPIEDAQEIAVPRKALIYHLCHGCSQEQFANGNKIQIIQPSNDTFISIHMCSKCYAGNLKISKCL